MSDFSNFINTFSGNSEDKPEDKSDFEHWVSLVGKNLGRGAVTGVGYAADVISNLVAPSVMNSIQKPRDVILGHGKATEATDTAYTNIVGDEKPRNQFEEFVASISQGVGSAALGGPEGGLAGLARGVLGGAAGGAAAKAVQDYTGSESLAAIAGLAAGAGAGLHGGRGKAIRAGMQHPEYAQLVDSVIPALEGGGTFENPKVNEKSGAMGVMQVTPETARKPGYGIKPWDGKSQEDLARVGREKFAVLLHMFDGDTSKALAAYNWGEGNVKEAISKYGDSWINHAPKETRDYVNKGMDLTYGGAGTGSVGGSVPPMSPEDMASAMGERPVLTGVDAMLPSEQHPLATDNGEIVQSNDNVVDIAKARQDRTDANNLAEVHGALEDVDAVHEAISNKDWEVVPDLQDLIETRKTWADYLEKLNRDRVHRDPVDLEPVHELVNAIDDAISRVKDGVLDRAPPVDTSGSMLKNSLELNFGEPRKTPEPANEPGTKQEAITRALYEHLTGKPAPPHISMEDMLSATREKIASDGDIPRTASDRAEERGFGSGKPPSGGGDEPPFGGGGEGGGEPPKPEGEKYAGSINLNRLAISDAAKENIKLMAAPMNMDIETFHETRHKAQALIDEKGVEGVLNTDSVKPEDLAHYATAIRAIHAAAQERMVKLNEAFLNPENNSDAVHEAWQHSRDVLAAAFERNQQVAKGLGRGLGAMRIEVGGDQGNLGEKVADLMKSRASDEEVARLIADHPEQAGRIARDSKKPGFNEVLFTTWYAMLLSSPRTLAKNLLSNTIMNVMDTVLIHPVSAGIGLLHGGQKMTFRAAAAGMGGLARGTLAGFANMGEAYRRGSPSDFAERTQAYWKPENKGIGRVLSAPMRTLSAQDQFFLDAAQNAEYYRMAHVKAAEEGLTGQDYRDRVQELIDNPTAAMDKQAVKYAQMMRFQDPMEFKGLEYATRATPKDPLMIKIMKGFLRVLFPFPRNSDRMFFAAMRNSPLGVLEPQNLRDFRAGGAKRDVAMARVIVGTGVSAAIYMWAANGGITGANPSDPSKKFMINFPGGVHVSYQGLADPFSTTIGAIATAVEDAKTGTQDLYGKIFKGTKDLLGVLMSSTWATGASQFFQAADDQTGKTMQAWIGRMASSITTPALVREINQDYIDPTVRNTKTNPISDTVKAGLPGLSQTLPARHDVFGDKIVRENPAYLNAINPARVQIDKHPELSNALEDIKTPTPLLSKAPSSVTIDGVKHKLSAKGQEKYQRVSGKIFTQLMAQNVSMLQGLSNEDKIKLVRHTMSDARKQARQEIWGAN